MEILFLGASTTANASAAAIAINLSRAQDNGNRIDGNLWTFPTSFPSFVVAACRRWWWCWKFPCVEQTTNNNLFMTQFDPIVLVFFQFHCLKRHSINCAQTKLLHIYLRWLRWCLSNYSGFFVFILFVTSIPNKKSRTKCSKCYTARVCSHVSKLSKQDARNKQHIIFRTRRAMENTAAANRMNGMEWKSLPMRTHIDSSARSLCRLFRTHTYRDQPPHTLDLSFFCRNENRSANRVGNQNGAFAFHIIQPTKEQRNETNCSLVVARYYSAFSVSATGIVAATTHINPIQESK